MTVEPAGVETGVPVDARMPLGVFAPTGARVADFGETLCPRALPLARSHARRTIRT